MLTSLTHPHDPFAITQEYWDRYDHEEIDMPTVSQLTYDELDAHSQRLYHVNAMYDYTQTAKRVRNARHAYYGMISYVDDKVGQIIRALEVTGQRDNTIVLFVSDHGEMLGERGMWYKMSFFEWSARIPLIINAPNRFASNRVATPVSLVDILPTLTHIAGVDDDPVNVNPLDGKSLISLAEGTCDERSIYGEHLGEGAISPLLMIRRGNYKYIFSEPDPEQLYDISSDPNERDNLVGQPEYESLRRQFHTELMEKWDVEGLHKQVIASQRNRRFIDRALRKGLHTPWDFQLFEDSSLKYMRNHLNLNTLEKNARYPSPQIQPPDGPNKSD